MTEEQFDAFRDGEVHVLSRKCSTCIFRRGNLMALPEGRKEGMEVEANAAQSAIICHQTLYGQTEHNAVCRGYFDVHRRDNPTLQIAERLGALAYDEPPK